MKVIEEEIKIPKGYKAAAVSAGIKKENRLDMALIFSESPCVTAGTYTTNVVKAAPVLWDKEITASDTKARAIVVNSGVANACTGKEGMLYCEDTAKTLSEKFNILPKEVLVASTGVIGAQLPMDKIKSGIEKMVPDLKEEVSNFELASKAIMTTDTLPKKACVTLEIGGKEVTITGMCKGSGMIHPNMCTMLSFIITDLAISKNLLQKALSKNVDDTYNMISVDGDTSTNDTVLLLANGKAQNPEITEENEDYKAFEEALNYINETLAKKIASDGEGATALFEMTVKNAATKKDAKILSKSVITSNLTKAAIFGHDANWGRIICALGYSGVDFDPEVIDLYFESKAGKIDILKNGNATSYSEETATKILSEPYVKAVADMKNGKESATAWGCDLTYEYVKINADYRS
ncbi:glutamate N-acetyltransferase [Acetitomaculum ruminis DSM 5522]|uniref:Arginine biosynthesis bifunctional protein ArgJ n=1 Tax=Acetitomaculum ruminis DSM 5522 TaxID=1120918 RepID=A0A1I1AGW7_9FIRM|nr:bifunctional glutamate N-acetyltransferase/amino-acid acetyltransferase ArgJ [Acetitomaculum ruminis]SFB37187.1 glutamate N-acetyltransferase [Acetitomaculum ruminis DSM 5522]